MIIYLHGFDSNSPGNHEKVLQLQFIDPDVRLISYSTRHPKHDMQHLLKEVDKMLQLNVDERPLICGVGLGGYWAERIGFLCDMRQVIFNPNLFPYENMEGKIDRPEEYEDIATKCVSNFREKNRDRCLVILSRQDAGTFLFFSLAPGALSPGDFTCSSFIHQNLMHINFGMTIDPFVLFSRSMFGCMCVNHC